MLALLDGMVDLLEVKKTINRAYFVKFAVDSGSDNFGFTFETEVFEVVDSFFSSFIVHDECSPFDGVEYFGGVETERREISPVQYGFAIDFNTKGMCSIIYDFEPIFISNVLNSLVVARLSIAVDRQDSRGLWSDGSFDFIRVDVAGFGVDVNKYRLKSIPPDAVGRCNETVGCGNDFPLTQSA